MSSTDRTREEILTNAVELQSPSTPVEERINISLQILQLEVLLDIRDALYRIENKEGVPKWGPKI